MLFQKMSGKRTTTSMVSPSAALTLWMWGGGNTYGQLGLGDVIPRSSPVQVGVLNTWQTPAQTATLATTLIKVDGTLWAWGVNQYGTLGLGDVLHRSSPVQVGTLATWSKVCMGWFGQGASLGLKIDGTLWGWGNNARGGVGDGTVIPRSSPAQVGTLATWSQIATGLYHSLATKTDRTLWAWGRNDGKGSGALGLGDGAHRSSPVQVGTLAAWSQIMAGYAHSLALKTDGTLWMWGGNTHGQLGLGDAAYRSSPVQVGTLATWSSVLNGSGFHSFAIKNDGALWAWGRNDLGQLGLGNAIYRSSPVQVGTHNMWLKAGAGKTHSAALKTDGTLWVWGSGSNGYLGQGDTVGRSSPVQVGTLATWVGIGVNYHHIVALRT